MNHNIIYIVIAWSLLAFVGYNVLSAEAEKKDCSSITEPDDDFYCDQFDWGAFGQPDKESADEACDASEDYAKNPKNCDIAYELVEKQDKNLKKDLEEACDKAGGKMEDGYCDVKESDGKQADKFYEEQVKEEQQNKKIEKICDKVDGKMTKDGFCDTDGSGDTPKADKFHELMDKEEGAIIQDRSNEVYDEEPPVIEDWANEVELPEEQHIGEVHVEYSDDSEEEEPEQEEEEEDNSYSES